MDKLKEVSKIKKREKERGFYGDVYSYNLETR